MADNDRTVVLVLGMHRSGTSALTGMLNCFGADVPLEQNTRIAGDNPKGHWEHNQIVRLNDMVLRHFGLTWTTWSEIDLKQVPEGLARRLKTFVHELINNADSSVVVFKDPRFCLLLPLWEAVLGELGHSLRYLYCARNPDAVARSIVKRNPLSYERGLLLWLHYNLSVLKRISAKHCFRTTFPDWMGQPETIYQEGAKQLGISWPVDWVAAEPQVDEFVDAKLVHHASEPARSGHFLHDECQELFGLIEQSACPGTDTTDELRAFIRRTEPWISVCGQAVLNERELWRDKVTDMYNLMHRNL